VLIKVHPIILFNRLQKTANDSLSKQHNNSSPAIKINREDEWKVEEVLTVRKKWNRLKYQVKWLGFDEDSEWYLALNLTNALHKLWDYYTANPSQSNPPQQLIN
jgi:hypothetical protein